MQHNIDSILQDYLTCALWSSGDIDNENEPLDSRYSISDFTETFKIKSKNEIIEFVKIAGSMLDDWNDEQIGHDLWLTRNGHGTGFWDRKKPYKNELSNLVGYNTQFKPIDLYVNDNNEIDAIFN